MKTRWKAPNNPNGPAKEIYARLWPGEKWPRGWRVEWAGFMRGALGLCLYGEKRILLSYADAKKKDSDVLRTVVHEFMHMRNRGLRHGKEWRQIEDRICARLGLAQKYAEDGSRVQLP
jgi:hypothetical protein